MKPLLVALALALTGCGVGVDADEGPEAGTVAQPLQTPVGPPHEGLDRMTDPQLFGLDPRGDPNRQNFQDHFAYTVPLPH